MDDNFSLELLEKIRKNEGVPDDDIHFEDDSSGEDDH